MRKILMIAALVVTAAAFPACITFPEEPYGGRTEPEVFEEEDYEVAVYDSWEFTGHRRDSWTLEPGMRQKLVRFVGWNLNDRISSIRVGYRVGVAMFQDRYFRGSATIYYGSQGRLDMEVNDKFSSLIIFHKDVGEPLGVWLGGSPISKRSLRNWAIPPDTWFFPLPEFANDTVAKYKEIDEANDIANWVIVAPVGSNRAGVRLEVTLFEDDGYRNRSITLPGFRSNAYYFDLKDFQFEGKVSSLIVRELSRRRGFRPRTR